MVVLHIFLLSYVNLHIHGTVIQGFISSRRVIKYLPDTKQGSVYSFLNFYVSKSKMLYRVVDHSVTVSFSHNTAISVLEESPVCWTQYLSTKLLGPNGLAHATTRGAQLRRSRKKTDPRKRRSRNGCEHHRSSPL